MLNATFTSRRNYINVLYERVASISILAFILFYHTYSPTIKASAVDKIRNVAGTIVRCFLVTFIFFSFRIRFERSPDEMSR